MFSDPAAAAWVAAGRPGVDAPPQQPGRCGRCGTEGPTVTSSRIISESFTGFDAWPYGSRRLCTPCAWAYTQRVTNTPALLITSDTVTAYPAGSHLAPILTAGPLPHNTAAVLVVARPPRQHVLPAAQWGHLAVDRLVLRWDLQAATRLTALSWLRATTAVSWKQLGRDAPPSALVISSPREHRSRILADWALLDPWRRIRPLWAAAELLTQPTTSPTPKP